MSSSCLCFNVSVDGEGLGAVESRWKHYIAMKPSISRVFHHLMLAFDAWVETSQLLQLSDPYTVPTDSPRHSTMSNTPQAPTPDRSRPSAGSGFLMTRSEVQEIIYPEGLWRELQHTAELLPLLVTGSALFKELVNRVLRYTITIPLQILYWKSGYNVPVYPSVLVEVGTSNPKKRKTCEDGVRHMFKNLLDLRREIETAHLRASAAIQPAIGSVEIFDKSVVTGETDNRGSATPIIIASQLLKQLIEKINNVLEERPIAKQQGSTTVQEVHSAEDQDFKDYVEEFRGLIRW